MEAEKKHRSKPLTASLKLLKQKEDLEDSERYTSKSRKVTKLAHAKRLLSNVIYEFQRGIITDQKAKTICYLLINFVQITKDLELESKVKSLETKAQGMEDEL